MGALCECEEAISKGGEGVGEWVTARWRNRSSRLEGEDRPDGAGY